MKPYDWYILAYGLGFICAVLLWNQRRKRRSKARREVRMQRKALQRLEESGSTNER